MRLLDDSPSAGPLDHPTMRHRLMQSVIAGDGTPAWDRLPAWSRIDEF